jgi:hypothetical protein
VDTRIKSAHDRVGCADGAAGRSDDVAQWFLGLEKYIDFLPIL